MPVNKASTYLRAIFFFQKYAEKSTKLRQQYEIDLAEYKASGMAAEFAASGSKTPTKAAAK